MASQAGALALLAVICLGRACFAMYPETTVIHIPGFMVGWHDGNLLAEGRSENGLIAPIHSPTFQSLLRAYSTLLLCSVWRAPLL